MTFSRHAGASRHRSRDRRRRTDSGPGLRRGDGLKQGLRSMSLDIDYNELLVVDRSDDEQVLKAAYRKQYGRAHVGPPVSYALLTLRPVLNKHITFIT